MSFDWSPALATGHADLDRQHREILVRASRLAATLAGSPAQPEPLQSLGAMAEYVYDHFDAEERLMRASAFPGLEAHRQAHARLCQDFLALAERFRLGGSSEALADGVSDFVINAIAAHVRDADQELAAHLAATGDARLAAGRPGVAPAGALPPTAAAALDAAARELDRLEHPACLLDRAGRVVHCNPPWDAFAGAHQGEGRATASALRGRDYLSCLRGDPLVRQLAGLLARAQSGVAQEISSTCHTAAAARLLTVRYRPVAMRGGVAGVVVSFRPDHVFPISDLFELHAPDVRAYLGEAGRVEACACCGRVRRRDRPVPTWEFVPDYLGGASPPAVWAICGTCFADQFGLTRG